MSSYRHKPSIAAAFTSLLVMLTLIAALPTDAHADDPLEGPTVLLGGGIQRMPAWLGADHQRNQPVPFIYAELPWHVTLSTTDGLTVDLIHESKWHGGLYGNYQWGRDRDELGHPLEGIVDSLPARLNLGGYLEYHFTVQFDVGTNVSHDTNGAGAYYTLYADYDLPAIGYLMHSMEVQWQGMNGPAMRRFFGLTPHQAEQLGVDPWSPGCGSQQIALEYSAFMPTSLHTGFALLIDYTRLLDQAADSPLVRHFGNANQLTTTLAFSYRF